jgi:hypothetical protein
MMIQVSGQVGGRQRNDVQEVQLAAANPAPPDSDVTSPWGFGGSVM